MFRSKPVPNPSPFDAEATVTFPAVTDNQPPRSDHPYAGTMVADLPPRKRAKRVFMWTFLVIQALFLIWIITGIAGNSGHYDPSHAEVLKGCSHGAWRALFQSRHDCMVHYASGLKQAGEAGTAIGAGLIVVFWVAVDVILGIGRIVVVLARRPRHA
jgi:hypothetical protein